MWKNKHAGVSAKMPKKVKERQRRKGMAKEDGGDGGLDEDEKGKESIAEDAATATTENTA